MGCKLFEGRIKTVNTFVHIFGSRKERNMRNRTTKILNAGQLSLIFQIEVYIQKREKYGEYKHFWHSLFGGFSKDEKLNAARDLLACASNKKPVSILTQHWEVLNQGNLRELFLAYKALHQFNYNLLEEAVVARGIAVRN